MASLADLLADIRSKMPAEEGRLFGYEVGNYVGGLSKFLFDTPQARWSDTFDVDPPHSSRFPEALRTMIAKAARWVDIVTMDEPTGAFLDEIVAGIGDTYAAGRRPIVRFLMGRSFGNFNLDTKTMLWKIATKLEARGGALPEMYLAQIAYQEAKSWNHAKIVAIDGCDLMTGGHNLWAPDYLEKRPIFDMSMRFEGPIAKGGHMFANALWKFVRNNNVPGTKTYSNSLRPETRYQVGGDAPRSEWAPPADPPPVTGTLPAMWVTNSGWGVFPNHIDKSDSSGYYAFYRAMLDGKHCRISQQDFGARFWERTPNFTEVPLDGYPYPLICHDWHFFNRHLVDAIAMFLHRSDTTSVDMVLTSPDGRGHYNNLISFKSIFNVVGYRMTRLRPGLSKEQAFRLLKTKFRLAKLSSGGKDTWSNGEPKRNHAKFWMVDDLFYVGSENFYPSTVPPGIYGSIQEFGVVAQDGAAVRSMILDTYFNPMMAKAVRGEVKLEDLTW